jgi:prepilin-type N-terminal cleavage/methylation domain-containing protein
VNKNTKGFTLIELLVVIAIIGLLSTLAVIALNSARQKSRDSKRVADVKQIQTALELYFADNNSYPADPTASVLGVAANNTRALCTGGFKSACASGDTVYMGLVPAAPTPEDSPCSSAQNSYTYDQVSSSSYTITFCIGAQVGDLAAGGKTASENGIQ